MSEHVHVSDLRWDRLLADELDSAATSEVLAAAAECTTCAARHAELVRERDAFAKPFVAPARSRRWIGISAAIAAAAAAVLVVSMRRDPAPTERTKGSGPKLVVEVGAPGRLALASSGDRVRSGDHVQAGYSSAHAGFGAVLGRTGADRATIYVPSSGDAMMALPAGELRSFPESTVLDDATGDETFVVVWCETARPLAPLVTELDTRGDLADHEGCWHRRIVLHKGTE